MKGLARRLDVLESRLHDGEILLTMPDGTTRRIRNSRLLPMIGEVLRGGDMRNDLNAVLASQFDNCRESGSGDLVALIKVMVAARMDGDLNEETLMSTNDQNYTPGSQQWSLNVGEIPPNTQPEPPALPGAGGPCVPVTPIEEQYKPWNPTGGSDAR